MLKTSSNGTQATTAIKFSLRPTAETLADLSRPIDPRHLQGRLKVISSRARCHASQCEHSPDVVAQFLLTRVN